jgi:hypothetical protein
MTRLSIVSALALAFAALPASADDKISARLDGYQENPSISTTATGTFHAVIADDESAIRYRLTYTNLQGTVTQAHIHIARFHVNGGISAWLCGTGALPGPAGTPPCPPGGAGQEAEVEGVIEATDVIGPTGQLVAPGELAELIAAIRAGAGYANVHSSLAPGGEIRGQIGGRGTSGLGHRH